MARRFPFASLAGLGFSDFSRGEIGTPRDLAIDAIINAVEDSGLALPDLDGLMISRSPSSSASDVPLRLRQDLGLGQLRLLGDLQMEGASVVGAIVHACLYIHHGLATAVACVFADVPLRSGRETGRSAYNRAMPLSGLGDWEAEHGLLGAAGPYALAARRYLDRYGLRPDILGHYAIACRRWAMLNPQAMLRDSLNMADYLSSRMVVDPFRVLDCAYPVNGAVAIVLTSPDRAKALKHPPVHVHAFAQGHTGAGSSFGEDVSQGSAGSLAAGGLWKMTGMSPKNVRMAQLYDAFSYVGLQAMEDYGLCPPGEAAGFVSDGHTSPGGRLPVNTGGGHLSGYYLQGMTPVAESILQGRSAAGERQSRHNEVILVTGNGGCLDYHAALLLSPLERM